MTDLNETIKRLRGQVDWDFGRVMVNRRDLNSVLDELEKRREVTDQKLKHALVAFHSNPMAICNPVEFVKAMRAALQAALETNHD